MNTTARIERPAELSPKSKARLAGVLLLMAVLGGVATQGFIAGRLIIGGDGAATAHNISTHERLYRLGFAIYLIEMACQIAATVLLYDLLKPVSRSTSALAAAFGLIGCTVKTMARLFYLAPLLLLGGAHSLDAFEPMQLQAAALLSLRLNYIVETIAMVFFGLFALLQGCLVFRSTFLPRALGVLSAMGGLGWLIYLYEPLALRLQPGIVGLAVIGALAMVYWLVVKGVDEHRWREQASTSSSFHPLNSQA
jgi:hypothetical protein